MVPFKIATCTFSPFLQEPSSKLLYKNHMTQGQVVQFIPWINFTSCKWNRLLATFLVTVTLFHFFFFHFFSSCLKCSKLLNWFFTRFLCELSLMCTLPIICDFRGYPYTVYTEFFFRVIYKGQALWATVWILSTKFLDHQGLIVLLFAYCCWRFLWCS